MKEYKYIINGTEYQVTIGDIVENIANVTVNGEDYKVEMEKEPEPEKKKVVVKTGGAAQAAPAESAPAAAGAPVNTSNALKAPLPGVIIDVKVAVGDTVAAGDTVVVLDRSGESRRQCHGRHPTCCHRITFHKEPLFKGTRSTPRAFFVLFCIPFSLNDSSTLFSGSSNISSDIKNVRNILRRTIPVFHWWKRY